MSDTTEKVSFIHGKEHREIIKKRVPRSVESITQGAANLSLEDKIKLRDRLNEMITQENEAIQTMAEKFAKLVNGDK